MYFKLYGVKGVSHCLRLPGRTNAALDATKLTSQWMNAIYMRRFDRDDGCCTGIRELGLITSITTDGGLLDPSACLARLGQATIIGVPPILPYVLSCALLCLVWSLVDAGSDLWALTKPAELPTLTTISTTVNNSSVLWFKKNQNKPRRAYHHLR